MKKQLLASSKAIYLLLVKISSLVIKKKQRKVIFLLSFPSTSDYLLNQLFNEFGDDLVICYTKNSKELAKNYQKRNCQIYAIQHLSSLLFQIVPLLKASPIILCDNYFAFLAGITFSPKTEVVQIWHANGAIKKFGLEANYAKKVGASEKKRYERVYQSFTKFVVSSDKMAGVFGRNYQVDVNSLPFGYPLTDLYFDKSFAETAKHEFAERFGRSKKVLLYVPTYREDQNESVDRHGMQTIQDSLSDDWLIFVHPHPHDKDLLKVLQQNSNLIIDFKGLSLQQLLFSVTCLVTDYSSIPFEYSLANPKGKVVFYCYDLAAYQMKVGIERDFTEWIPGKLVETEKDLLAAVLDEDIIELSHFNQLWNCYAEGNASNQLIEWMKKNYENGTNYGDSCR